MSILVTTNLKYIIDPFSLAAAAVVVCLQMRDREGAVEERFGDSDMDSDSDSAIDN